MAYSVLDLIKASLRAIGVLAKSEPPSADETADALQALNFLLDEWSVESTMVLAAAVENFTLTANKESYTIGTSGDFNTAKPSDIVGGYVRDSNNNDSPIEVVGLDVWQRLTDKKIATGVPNLLYFDPGATQQAAHTGTVWLAPIPNSATTYTIYLTLQKALTELANSSATVTFPPAYFRALKYNLAVDLWDDYFHEKGDPVPAMILRKAKQSRAVIEAMNSRQPVARMEIPGRSGGFNIYSGE